MKETLIAITFCSVLALLACHYDEKVTPIEESDASGCSRETPEQTLSTIETRLQEVVDCYSGFPPGYENNVRMAFQDVLDEAKANLPNVRR
jgi:hypothetical protein